jgi:hypothetical protein
MVDRPDRVRDRVADIVRVAQATRTRTGRVNL